MLVSKLLSIHEANKQNAAAKISSNLGRTIRASKENSPCNYSFSYKFFGRVKGYVS